jgi:hypothetical protein
MKKAAINELRDLIRKIRTCTKTWRRTVMTIKEKNSLKLENSTTQNMNSS